MKKEQITSELLIYPEMGKTIGTVRWDGPDLPERRGDLIVAPLVGGGFAFYASGGFVAANGDHMVFAIHQASCRGARWEAYNEGAALSMLTFKEACNRFPHRFTMEHVPAWATKPAPNGRFYAPQHASDKEWYETTAFPHGQDNCESTPTWPLGVWLAAPYVRATTGRIPSDDPAIQSFPSQARAQVRAIREALLPRANLQDMDVHACRGDFWNKLEAAVCRAGGRISIDELADMRLKDVVDMLAQNGIRMAYDAEWHLDPR